MKAGAGSAPGWNAKFNMTAKLWGILMYLAYTMWSLREVKVTLCEINAASDEWGHHSKLIIYMSL